ncbi:DUF4395 domain-containing protein [Lysinibacter cavernae]|uniref:DUF4395 domain-containing protein n=1 Tax=Lysinibacter cavernae TaxID=1640652 RepID=A0A7X5TRH9_9MICO|nr:hypothetical protein [Lysinibacter cavernae]
MSPSEASEATPKTQPKGIDPRGPRFGATITSVLLAITVFLGLIGTSASRLVGETSPPVDLGWALPSLTIAQRAADPAFILLVIIAALFAWGAFAGIQRHPYGLFFARVIRPRLAPSSERENPAAPTFAQGVGLIVVGIGLVLHLAGVPLALPLAAGAAFIAAFLNAAVGFCLGCQIYLLLQRAKPVGLRPNAT